MPQALKTLCLIHFFSWQISLFSVLVLWGNKNWPPSIKMKQIENCQDKMGLKGCKWSSLNVPGTETPVSERNSNLTLIRNFLRPRGRKLVLHITQCTHQRNNYEVSDFQNNLSGTLLNSTSSLNPRNHYQVQPSLQ